MTSIIFLLLFLSFFCEIIAPLLDAKAPPLPLPNTLHETLRFFLLSQNGGFWYSPPPLPAQNQSQHIKDKTCAVCTPYLCLACAVPRFTAVPHQTPYFVVLGALVFVWCRVFEGEHPTQRMRGAEI